MLDNFSPEQVKEAGEMLRKAGFGEVLLEEAAELQRKHMEYAAAQVDIISMGELTHSVKALESA